MGNRRPNEIARKSLTVVWSRFTKQLWWIALWAQRHVWGGKLQFRMDTRKHETFL
jgi:hypothetical protein